MFDNNRLVAVFVSVLLGAGCVSYPAALEHQGSNKLASHDRVIALDVNDCRESLSESIGFSSLELDSTSINFLSWNIKKGQMTNWRHDLLNLADGKNIVMIQEAVLESELTEAFSEPAHWSFSTGYQSKLQVTGVMTFSSSEPLTQCNLMNWEPWLGTPKAINITEYGLSGTEQSLIVVNLHAINFTFGVGQYQNQIDQIKQILLNHDGPIILSGDFNTWRKERIQVLESVAAELDLKSLSFQKDYRKKVFGYSLDHIYIRGLTVKNALIHQVRSSDHNPLTAEFYFKVEI
jgi:endonuclease/exonuclease/phosphatase (EEP) superfamily protein YafD